jgi:hypothetical protein
MHVAPTDRVPPDPKLYSPSPGHEWNASIKVHQNRENKFLNEQRLSGISKSFDLPPIRLGMSLGREQEKKKIRKVAPNQIGRTVPIDPGKHENHIRFAPTNYTKVPINVKNNKNKNKKNDQYRKWKFKNTKSNSRPQTPQYPLVDKIRTKGSSKVIKGHINNLSLSFI